MNNIKINKSINQYANNSSVVPSTNIVTAKLDSGATNHYFQESEKNLLKNIRKIKKGQNILLPNGNKLQTTQEGDLIIPTKNIKQTVNILPQLKTTSLLSVGKLVDDGCTAQVTKNKAIIYKNKKSILQGKRNLKDGIYDIQFKIKTNPNNNNKIFTDMQR